MAGSTGFRQNRHKFPGVNFSRLFRVTVRKTLLPNRSIAGTGIVGDVYFKKVDLASAAISMTQTRLQYIDYLPPLAPYELRL